MRWTLLDGSPRGRRGNTSLLLAHLWRGLEAAGEKTEILHLARRADRAAAPGRFAEAERFVLGFPLYVDAMPGLVMDFIERLAPYVGRQGNPPIAFLVQSGFPEPGQSRTVERYLELLARRLGSTYLGTIVKGGAAGILPRATRKSRRLLAQIETLGRGLGATGRLDPAALRALAGPEWLSGWRAPILRLTLALGANPHWNQKLRENGVWGRRFDRPYAPP